MVQYKTQSKATRQRPETVLGTVFEWKFRKRKDMTKLKINNASIVSQYGGDGMYEIALTCRLKDVTGEIVEVIGLDVEIKSKEDGHRD